MSVRVSVGLKGITAVVKRQVPPSRSNKITRIHVPSSHTSLSISKVSMVVYGRRKDQRIPTYLSLSLVFTEPDHNPTKKTAKEDQSQ